MDGGGGHGKGAAVVAPAVVAVGDDGGVEVEKAVVVVVAAAVGGGVALVVLNAKNKVKKMTSDTDPQQKKNKAASFLRFCCCCGRNKDCLIFFLHGKKNFCFIQRVSQMLSYQNYAEYGGNTILGGIMSDSEEEEEQEDHGQRKGMELDGVERIQEAEMIDITTLTFPQPAPLILYKGPVSADFHFDKDYMAAVDFPQLPPQVMKALSGGAAMANELCSVQMAGYCTQPCMPMVVHSSPLVSFFENSAKHIAPVLHDTYTSFMYSCYQLHQLRYACVKGFIPFHPSMTGPKLKQIIEECSQQSRLMGQEQDAQLDAFYSEGDASTWNVHAFVALMERNALQYIHLLEYFLHTCLIAPYKSGIELEHVLTPNVVPTLQQVKFERRERVVQDLIKFFTHKHEMQGGKNLQVSAIYPLMTTEGTERYKGYVPMQTLKEYMIYMEDKQN